ncbi:MAG: UDP-N-acetylmuramyl peptide synthase [Tatlockia sp.]|jgi:cyanophycin synthetase
MNKNTQLYYESALKLLLPAVLAPDFDGFKIKLGKKSYYFCGAAYPLNNAGSSHVARNKYSANKTLEKSGFPVPKAVVIDCETFQENELQEVIAELSFPLVAKPQSGRLGHDVLCNIKTIEQLQHYIRKHRDDFEYISIEEFHGGLNAYRVLLFNNKIVGLVQRFSAHIIGDGVHTVQELIERANKERLHDTLGPIVVDEECLIRMDELQLGLDDIIPAKEKVTLNYTCNATRGGTYISLKIDLCKENRELLIAAARELNLKIVGFDIECQDINIPITTSGGVIIEANDVPSIRIHEYPMAGITVPISKKVMRSFIYKHPFAYLYLLYQHKHSARYVRMGIVALCMGMAYSWIGN